MVAALKRLAFPAEAQSAIWRVLAAVLHLGNVHFRAGEKEGTEVSLSPAITKFMLWFSHEF